jgi:glycerophosphoryl diester phosphodiesterase
VQSFRPEALRAVAELAPQIDRAILVRSPGAYERKFEQARATILSPRHDRLTRSALRRFQQRGIAVVPWTVNRPQAIARLVGWGVDGIITDYPDRALEISRRAAEDAR